MHASAFLQLIDIHQDDAGVVFVHTTSEHVNDSRVNSHRLWRSSGSHRADDDIITRVHHHHFFQLAGLRVLCLKADQSFTKKDSSRKRLCANSAFDRRLGKFIQKTVLNNPILDDSIFCGRCFICSGFTVKLRRVRFFGRIRSCWHHLINRRLLRQIQ